MATARENAIGLYMDGIRDGRPREAMARYTGDRYTQHSTGVEDGQAGFIAFFEAFVQRNPKRDIRVVRALQDGPHVFLQVEQSLNDGAARWVTADVFDSDADGRIVEHWDVISPTRPPNPAGHTQIDGPTEIVDRDATAANKALVADFVQTCLIERRLDRVADFVDRARYVEHDPDVGDLDGFLAELTAKEAPLSYQACFMLVGEGNFVATLNRARRGEQDQCRVDLFRVDAGRIVEHWDHTEPVPPKAEWVNSGKF